MSLGSWPRFFFALRLAALAVLFFGVPSVTWSQVEAAAATFLVR